MLYKYGVLTTKSSIVNMNRKQRQTRSPLAYSSGDTIELRRGMNMIAFDSSGREREFREKYFSERLDKPKNKQPRETLDDFNFYNVSMLVEQNMDLEKVVEVIDVFPEGSKFFSIKSLKYIGDTHAPADEWKIDLELYEKRESS